MTGEDRLLAEDPFADPTADAHRTDLEADLQVGRGARLSLAHDSLIVHGTSDMHIAYLQWH